MYHDKIRRVSLDDTLLHNVKTAHPALDMHAYSDALCEYIQQQRNGGNGSSFGLVMVCGVSRHILWTSYEFTSFVHLMKRYNRGV